MQVSFVFLRNENDCGAFSWVGRHSNVPLASLNATNFVLRLPERPYWERDSSVTVTSPSPPYMYVCMYVAHLCSDEAFGENIERLVLAQHHRLSPNHRGGWPAGAAAPVATCRAAAGSRHWSGTRTVGNGLGQCRVVFDLSLAFSLPTSEKSVCSELRYRYHFIHYKCMYG